MHEISIKNEIWNLLFQKNQGFQNTNDRNWATIIFPAGPDLREKRMGS